MASRQDDGESEQTDTSHGPRECMPCRGSGQVISNLGGEPSKVSCPWCGGDGIRLTGIDAQARWLDGDGDSAAAAGTPADAVD